MKTITESKIRQIIREEIETQQAYNRVIPSLKSVMSYAERYVESIVQGNRDAESAEGLSEALMDFKLIVKLLQKSRAPEASNMATLGRLASELADKSGFWQTPSFIGTGNHRKELATHLARMKKVAQTIASSISAAGHAPRSATSK